MAAEDEPVACITCGREVYWHWRDGRPRVMERDRRHACTGRCLAVMARGETCMRLAGHRFDHRSQYAMDNAARSRREGWEA
jgi:hypothetical protein